MYFCPKCKIPLKKASSPFGIFWSCPTCSGRAVSLNVLRQVIPQNIINKLWLRAKSGEYKSLRDCPICEEPLPEVPIINNDKTINLDICTKCCFIWFDGQEYESLPKIEITKPKEELPPEAREALAKFQIECIARESEWNNLIDNLTPHTGGHLIDNIFYLIFTGL
jgi:Zn-finger nucleic acid-binding protein